MGIQRLFRKSNRIVIDVALFLYTRRPYESRGEALIRLISGCKEQGFTQIIVISNGKETIVEI